MDFFRIHREASEAVPPSPRSGHQLDAKIVELNPGERRRVSIPFVASATGLAHCGELPVPIGLESSGAAGNDAARTAAVVLRIPRP
jgi:hypothetical protein